ncbi:MAG: Gfo/Idh/MocA family oxidoreductase [Pirellulales bacterium]|nr:Gfo/Idh/MocA family oxidoreductase [Pirellulales bacterium]
MSDKIGLALVGCGGISSRHVDAYRILQEKGDTSFELVACCDPVVANAQETAAVIEGFQGKKPATFSDVDGLIDAKLADAADICTPHAFHHSTAIALLGAGLHVQVEKPLGLTIKASQAIIAAAEKAGRVLSIAENVRRCLPSRACTWAIREQGVLGEPLAAHIQEIDYQPYDYTNPRLKWRGSKLMTGGGMLMDSGAHFADMIQVLFGDVDEVFCTMATHQPARITGLPKLGDIDADTEDTWHAVIRFKSGMHVTWSYSRVFRGDQVRLGRYYGSQGTIDDQGFAFHCFEDGGVVTRPDGTEQESKEIEAAYLASLSPEQEQHLFPLGLTNGFHIEVYDFLRAIRTGQPVEMDGEAAIRAKALCESCYESAVARAPVRYDDVLSGKVSAYQDPINDFWDI